jgi:hypothetical protein
MLQLTLTQLMLTQQLASLADLPTLFLVLFPHLHVAAYSLPPHLHCVIV